MRSTLGSSLQPAGLKPARRFRTSVARTDVHSRLVHLIAKKDTSQVRTIVTVTVRQKRSATEILACLQCAANQLYRAKSFSCRGRNAYLREVWVKGKVMEVRRDYVFLTGWHHQILEAPAVSSDD